MSADHSLGWSGEISPEVSDSIFLEGYELIVDGRGWVVVPNDRPIWWTFEKLHYEPIEDEL